MLALLAAARNVANGTKRTSPIVHAMSAFGVIADIGSTPRMSAFDPKRTSHVWGIDVRADIEWNRPAVGLR